MIRPCLTRLFEPDHPNRFFDYEIACRFIRIMAVCF